MSTPSDVIFIVLDTQRADRLSCYGYLYETSPHLDALGRDATIFEQALAPAQWTIPSHASMFTGLYPSEHAMWEFNSTLPSHVATLAERLQCSGYFTAAFSNNPLVGSVQNGLQRGFERVKNYNYSGFGLWSSHLAGAESRGFKRNLQLVRRAVARLLGFDVDASRTWLSRVVDPVIAKVLALRGATKCDNTQASLEAAANLMIDRSEIEAGRPIFTFINLMGTHLPYDPPRWAVKKFLPQAGGDYYRLLHRVNATVLSPANWLNTSLPKAAYKDALRGVYDAEVAVQDAYLGAFFERLRRAGVLDRALVVVVADHGEQLGEKGLISHVFGAYQPLVRVPLIIRDPSGHLPWGKSVRSFVSTRRLFHSVLDFAQAAATSEVKLSLLHQDVDAHVESPEHNRAVVESLAPTAFIQRVEKYRPGLVREKGYDQLVRAVYEGQYKLILRHDQLLGVYAVREDPEECVDLRGAVQESVQDIMTILDQEPFRDEQLSEPVYSEIDDEKILEHLRGLGYVE